MASLSHAECRSNERRSHGFIQILKIYVVFSETIENRTHIHMNFFHQHVMTNLFPEGMTFFMNHPVYIWTVSDHVSFRKLGRLARWIKWSSAHPPFPLLHLRHNSFSNPSVALPTSQLILQSFRCFSYVTAHSPSLPSLYLRHSSFSIPSVALPTSQLILQLFSPFSYVTGSSLTSPGEPPMLYYNFSNFLTFHFKTRMG